MRKIAFRRVIGHPPVWVRFKLRNSASMPLHAEHTDGALVLIFSSVFLFVILGLFSFWPAARGHWSALFMAAPSVLLGGFLSWSLVSDPRPDHGLPDMWFLFPAPLAVGVVAILMWVSVRCSDYSK